jgi:hypothetical protein
MHPFKTAKIVGVSEKKTESYLMFKKYLGVLKCSVCSSDYIPLKFVPERFFPISQERKKKYFSELKSI